MWDFFLPTRHSMTERDVRVGELFAASLLVLMISSVLFLFLPVGLTWRKVTIVGGLAGSSVAGLLALRRGHIGVAAVTAGIGNWAVLTFACITGGGVYSPAFSAFLFINLIMGVVFGIGAALMAFGITFSTGLGLMLAQQQGFLPPSAGQSNPQSIWLINSVLQVIATALVIVITRMMGQFSSRADKEEIARRKIQEELHKSELKFRSLVQNSTDVITIHDIEGRIAYASPSANRVLGYAPKDLIGKTPFEMILPEDLPVAVSSLGDVVRGANDGKPTEYRFRRRDGSVIVLESLGSNHLGNPAVGGLIINTRDITDRRKAEESLRQSERLFRDVFEHSPVGILLLSLDGRILRTNARICQLVGYTDPELREKNVMDLTHPDDLDRSAKLLESLQDTGDSVLPIQKRYIAKDGSVVWVEGVTTPVRDGNGAVQYIIAHIQDVGERLKAEDRMLASLKEKEVLLKEIHHRVKNNLQVISSMLSLQSETVRDPRMLSMFSESQDRIRSMALIHEVLYRSEDLAAVPFGEYSRTLLGRLMSAYGARTVRTEMRVQDFALGVDQAIPCGLILNELVTNALKHAFPDDRAGLVCLNVALEEGRCHLGVTDDGVGLPEGFDAAETNTLGMQLVVTLTKQLEGRLEITSADPGAAFNLSFPVV
jgi:PAS domain S-box-containing protein